MIEIEEKALITLLKGSPQAVCKIKSTGNGFWLIVTSPTSVASDDNSEPEMIEFILHRKLGGVRLWRSLDKIYQYICKHGSNLDRIEIIC